VWQIPEVQTWVDIYQLVRQVHWIPISHHFQEVFQALAVGPLGLLDGFLPRLVVILLNVRRVIERFKINCEASMKEGKRQAANTALRILGMEVGLFQHV